MRSCCGGQCWWLATTVMESDKSIDVVHLWMIDQQLVRRSVSDFQRGVLALRKREIMSDRKMKSSPSIAPDSELQTGEPTNVIKAIFSRNYRPIQKP